MMDAETIANNTRIGQNLRFGAGPQAISIHPGGDAFVLAAAGGPRRLSPAQFLPLFRQIVARACESLQVRPPTINREVERQILSAAGWLCGHGGVLCPDCVERTSLAPLLGGATVDEALAAK